MVADTPINERAQYLLKVLVERYIEDGNPVGSRTLAREAGLDLSPATIRNVMADLEECGLISAPHTSAGRVPTAKGYRMFVDSLLSVKPLRGKEVEQLRLRLMDEESGRDLMATASDLLSAMTHMAGVVTLPRIECFEWRHIEFLQLSDNRVLAIMVLNEREVENRILHTARPYSASELEQAANYLNQAFVGKNFEQARERLVAEMREARHSMDRMMVAAIDMAEQVFKGKARKEDYVLAGEVNLMSFQELSDIDRLRELFEAFNQKRAILHILDRCQAAQGVQLFIGEESGFGALGECSMVTSPYQVDGAVVGVLGVIGPTRMAYERVIPIVDITAKLLGSALNHR